MSETSEAGAVESGAGYAITVAFDIVEERLAEFLSLVRANAAQSVALEPGCVRFDVLTPRDTGRAGEVLLYEIYVDRFAFVQHLASAHYKAFEEKARALVRGKAVTEFRVAQFPESA